MAPCSSGVFKIKPKINAFSPCWQERRQGGQCCLGLTVLPWGCSFLTKADPYFRCQAGNELDEEGSSSPAAAGTDQLSHALELTPLLSTQAFGSDSKAGRDEQGQQISQFRSTPRQNNTCLDISYTSRAIHHSSARHVPSFTLSKCSLTLAYPQRI